MSLYFGFSDSDAWPERWKWKYIFSGSFPFRFPTVFAFFSLAAAVRTAVHENSGADHLDKKCYFLEGFGHPELLYGPGMNESSKVLATLLFCLETAPFKLNIFLWRLSSKRRRT